MDSAFERLGVSFSGISDVMTTLHGSQMAYSVLEKHYFLYRSVVLTFFYDASEVLVLPSIETCQRVPDQTNLPD